MRIGVVGAGVMGRNHARVVHQSRNTLIGIVDPVLEGAREVARLHGTEAYGSLEELLDGPVAPEAVIVATPTETHGDLVLRALDAGLHVLVEKPIATDIPTARRMVDAAKDARRTLAVGHIERHNPVVAFAKKALAEGRFGKPITLSTRRVSNLPGRIRDVGCVLDIGIHDIDVLDHLAGGPPKRVFSVGGNHAAKGGLEDHANLLLDYGHVKGAVEVNWLTPRKVRKLALTCDEAFVECDYIEQVAEVSRTTFGALDPGDLYQVPVQTHLERIELIKEEPLRRELDDFVDACASGRPALADGEVGLQALAVAFAALRSLSSGRPEEPELLEVA
ncbi:MAG: Gfo/Idh/MocA family oxidoreductase [Euryarchaeota archaeon]|nr:Gfo/Idh/MocA family oxidoreductase [Euryarchaeota archaeon]